jgi:hypothetical protein
VLIADLAGHEYEEFNRPSVCSPTASESSERGFSLWLDDLIQIHSWNPLTKIWFNLLGQRSVNQWRSLDWEKRTLHLEWVIFTPRTDEIVRTLRRAAFFNERNRLSSVRNSQSRAHDSYEYVVKNRTLPSTLIFISDFGVLDVIDGCHRLAAYRHLQSRRPGLAVSVSCSAWIGTSAVAPMDCLGQRA